MAKPRDYSKEYRSRIRKHKGVPTAVARGHGTVPVEVAERLEKGQLSATERARHRADIEAYEAKYGPAGGGHVGRERTPIERFSSEEQARAWADENLPWAPEPYRKYKKVKGKWQVTILR